MKGVLSIIAIGIGCWLALSQPEREKDIATGSIEGTVVLASQQSRVRFGGGNRYGRASQTNKNSSQSAEDSVLIWLVSSETQKSSPPKTPVILDQKETKFNPSLLAIRQNGTIRIRNSDPVYHNVFSLSSTKKFDVGRRPKGEYMDVTFDKPGVVDVFCDIHSNMHAVIYVMPPNVLTWTKTKSGESFAFSDIPDGSYQLKFYALGYGERSIPIEVITGKTSSVGTITLNS